MGFSRQEYWNRLPCHPLGDLLDPGIEPESIMSPALAGRFFTTETPGKSYFIGMPQSKLNKLIFTKHGDNAGHIAGTA